jgi:hypothetical protein
MNHKDIDRIEIYNFGKVNVNVRGSLKYLGLFTYKNV